MHLYVIARGISTRLSEWVAGLQTIYLNHKKEPDEEAGLVQLAVRPIQLYEIVFPENYKDYVIQTIYPKGWGANPAVKLCVNSLYKALGCKKKVILPPEPSLFSRIHNAIDVVPIGIRPDKYRHITFNEKGERVDIRTDEKMHEGKEGVEDL